MELYLCPRCGCVEDDPADWEVIIVNDETMLLDCVCPPCLAPSDLVRPDRLRLLSIVDATLELIV